MNLRTIILAKLCISFLTVNAVANDWKIDFSRRIPVGPAVEVPPPAPSPLAPDATPKMTFIEKVLFENDPAPEIVILNTEKGFVPSVVTLAQGQTYRIHVVNVNEYSKNISFVMDSFAQHHATYYGQIRTFVIKPEAQGVYRYSSPETASIGKVVVVPSGQGLERLPASK